MSMQLSSWPYVFYSLMFTHTTLNRLDDITPFTLQPLSDGISQAFIKGSNYVSHSRIIIQELSIKLSFLDGT